MESGPDLILRSMPKISIIVPVYNLQDRLDRCMGSLLGQSHSDLEILLVDDGSHDASPGLCDAFAVSDQRVRAFHKTNGGPGSARNTGLAGARGEWILFVDGDDWLREDALERMLACAARHPGTDAVFCNHVDVVDGIPAPRAMYESEEILGRDEVLKGLLRRFDIGSAMWGKLFRAEWMRGLRVDEKLRIGEDLMFLLEAYSRPLEGRTALLPEALYHYDQTGGSLMKSPDKVAQDKRLLREVVAFAERTPEIRSRFAREFGTFVVRTAWSIAKDLRIPDPETTRFLRTHFGASLPDLMGHEWRPVALYLLRPSWGFAWFALESRFRKWLRTRRQRAAPRSGS